MPPPPLASPLLVYPRLFSLDNLSAGFLSGFPQVLAASAAVGLSSTFAATIGGVLFSIEITTLYYDIGNYFKAFVAAISGTVAVSLVRQLAEGSPVRRKGKAEIYGRINETNDMKSILF